MDSPCSSGPSPAPKLGTRLGSLLSTRFLYASFTASVPTGPAFIISSLAVLLSPDVAAADLYLSITLVPSSSASAR